jgi:hypothetical protein
MKSGMPFIILFCAVFLTGPECLARQAPSPAVDVRILSDEAESVLAILSKSRPGGGKPAAR